MAATVNISIDQGSVFEYLFQLQGTSQMDLVNAVPYAAMKPEYGSPANAAVSFVASMTGANVTVSMTSNTTSSLTPGTWVYDVIVVNSSNTVLRAVQGRVAVTPRVTPSP